MSVRHSFDSWPSRQTMISLGVKACQNFRICASTTAQLSLSPPRREEN
jgi:hypothetical protein